MTREFGMIEIAVRKLLELRRPDLVGHTGADLSYEQGDGYYVWIGLVGGNTTQIEGDWAVDIDVFADDYQTAMRLALSIESLLLNRPYGRTTEMRIDSITQNEAPVERPWDADEVFRIGATYAFTARRSA